MDALFQQLSRELAATVKGAGGSVVRVEARRRLPASGVIWSDDGLIVTASHVVRREDGLRVGLPDGRDVAATLVGRDSGSDLAVLRANASGLQAARPGDGLEVGHLVLALGRPAATVQATLGIVSALGDEPWRTPAGGQLPYYLQTDLVMYPGFSGGPLVDSAGSVLGMNSSELMRGVSLTVPSDTVSEVAQTLLAHGRVRRGYLGVNTQPARLPRAAKENLGQDTGLLIVGVEGGSPADAGGLVLGDTIVGFDGKVVRQHDDLLALLGGERVGRETPLRILRGGKLQTLDITVGER